MELRPELRRRLHTAKDWVAELEAIEREAEAIASEADKSERYYELGLLCEEVIPERERALAAYQRAWKIHPQNTKALARARRVYRDLGRLEMVAKLGDLEIKSEENPERRASLQMLVGEALLDLGQADRAAELLAAALAGLPDDPRIKDALAAAQYDKGDWLTEVERLTAEAESADSQTAARMLLRAARILRMEAPEDPAYEETLRKVLSNEPQEENANFMLESLLAQAERWEELYAHQEKRAYAAAEGDQARLYLRFAMEWLQRFKDRERAAGFFQKALAAAYEDGVNLQGQVAAFNMLRDIYGEKKEWDRLLELVDQALRASTGEDERVYAATLGGVVSWKEISDFERARTYFDEVRKIAADHPVADEFFQTVGDGMGSNGAGQVEAAEVAEPPEAAPAPEAAPVEGVPVEEAPPPAEATAAEAAPAENAKKKEKKKKEKKKKEKKAATAPAADLPPESLSDAQQALMDEAREAEGKSPDKAIEAWKKAIAEDPEKRAPRREYARVLREAERWNALVEALKEEESKACRADDERVAVLMEMAEVYRDHLRLDVMVASTLNQVHQLQPDNVEVLDALAAQYESMKRWPDLVNTLKKKAEALDDEADQVALYLQIANLYIDRFSNQAEAIKAFESVIEIDPDNQEAAEKLKEFYERRRDWEKLIGLSKREIARVEDPGERLAKTVELAKLSSEKLRKPSVSIEAWEDVLALDPNHPEALENLEKLYERDKAWDKLADVCSRLANLTDDTKTKVASLQKLGILYSDKVDNPDKAIDAWRRLLEVDPQNRRAQDSLKKLYVAQKAWDELEAFYTQQDKLDEYVRVLERQVDSEDDDTKVALLETIAQIYRDRLDKADRAMRAYEKILGIDEKNAKAAEALIPLYEGGRDPKKLANALEIQLEHTSEKELRIERIKNLAQLCDERLRDKAAALGWWLKAFGEDHEAEWIRAEVERVAQEAAAWDLLVEAYQKAYDKFSDPRGALPLLQVVARVQESELGEPDAALETNQRILEIDEENVQALDALERLYVAKQKFDDLLGIYEKKLSLTSDPDQKKAIQYKIGQLYEEVAQDDDKAIEAFKAVLAEFGDEREALGALDRIYARKERWSDLEEILKRELDVVGPDDEAASVDLKFRLGRVREDHLDNVGGAIECYREILDMQPQHAGARQQLEKRLQDKDNQLDAASILEPIYEKIEAWRDLIGVHEIQIARTRSTQKKVDLLLRIGELHAHKLGDAQGAFEAYARCVQVDPSSEKAREELEQITNILDDGHRRQVELYEQALARGGDELEPQLQYELAIKTAQTYEERLEQPGAAVEYYRKALAVEPEDRRALDALDRIFTRDEKYADLVEVCKKKAELTTDPEERLNLLFRVASVWEEMLSNPEEAIAAYKEVTGQDPENTRALKALDRLYQQQEHWQDLADVLTRQLALADTPAEQVDLLCRLAELRESKLGETAAAVDTYRQVLDILPNHEGAVTALERLIGEEEHELTIAQILEPIYDVTGDVQKQVGVYEIMVRHAIDPARKIELLHKIGELYEVGIGDMDSAFAAYSRALREDPAGEETQQRLERLARVNDKWQSLVELYDDVVREIADDELKVALLTKLAQIFELELQNDGSAVETYGRILEANPTHLEAASAIQTIHERNANYPALVEILKQKATMVLETDQKKALFYKAAQIEEEVLESADDAIATYQLVLDTDEIDRTAMDALERLYVRLERWEPLKDIYFKKAELAQEPEEKKQQLFVLGQVYDRELGDVAKAIETYQAILDIDPDDLNAIQALDRLYGQAERWYDLLQILEREVELAGSVGETVGLKFRIGQLWETELKDLTRAIEAYREAIGLDATHEPTLDALGGLVHADEGEPVLAAQVLEPIYEQTAEFEKLVDLYEVMAKHADDPYRKVELLHQIAQIYEHRLERHHQAFDAFGRALKEDPANEQTLGHLERLADLNRSWEQLAQLYEAELEKTLDAPRQVDLLLRLARVYEEELGQPDLAISTHRRVLDVESDSRRAIHSLDRLYAGSERWSELAEILRKEARLAETDEEIINTEFRLGQVYEQNLRDLTSAIDVYREILIKDPNHTPTLSALELLLAEGNQTLEIAAILEPIFAESGEYEKLHKIHTVQLERLTDPADRQAMYVKLAELAEERLLDAERAFRWWGAAFSEDPRNEKAAEEAERLAVQTQQWEELVQIYAGVLAEHGDGDVQRNVLLRLARVYDERLHDPGRAEEAYLRVLSQDDKDADALAALDRIYEAGGMVNELAEILRRRIDITMATDDLVELYFRLGKIQDDALGDLDGAIASYQKILEQDSANRRAIELLERVYFRREQWQDLYDVYEKMVDVADGEDEMAGVYSRMARIASDALDDEERATELWGRVLDIRGEDPIALGALADLHERGERWNELVEIVERQVAVVEEPRERIELYKRLGYVWAEKLGREHNALDAWLKAFDLDMEDLETLRALAQLYRSTQAWEELSDTLRRIIEVGQVRGGVGDDEMVDLYAQLGELEGNVLGRTDEAVEAWRKVLALMPAHFEGLAALENLFTREARWEECIDILERRAAVLEDPRQVLDTLLQAASIWEEKVGDKARAAEVYERVRASEPGNMVASQQLEGIYREQYNWEKLIEVLLERVEHTEDAHGRIEHLQQAAKVYEEELGDQESAFVVLQAAFKEDYAYEPVAKDLERLATAAGKWEELLSDYSQVVAGLEHEDPQKAADLWVKIGRWYGDHLNHVDYAIHSVQAALRLDESHAGALAAMANFQRKRGSWGELVETLQRHARVEEDDQKRVELYLNLAELWETQLGDPLQAISAYRSALETDESSEDALNALERLYRGNQMWEQLIGILGRKADVTSDPDEQVRLKLEIGRLWDEQLAEPTQAIDAFKQVLEIEPQSLPALRALERLYERTGQSEPYLDILEQQLDASPSDAEKISLYQRMASAWEERFGKLDRAAECLEKILVLDERNLDAYRDLERLYRQEQKWESLVDTYRRHVLSAGDPGTRIDLYCAMGQVYEEELNDADRAIEAYNDVLSFDPEEPRALEALGRLYEQTEDWDRAIDVMNNLAQATDDPQLKVNLLQRVGRILDQHLGDPDRAEEQFLQALAMNEAHVPTMSSLVELYKKRDDWQKAANMMVRAEQHTGNPLEKTKLLFGAAQIFHERLGNEDEAMKYYAATLALDPEHVEAAEPLAELYFKRQMYAELEPVLDMLVRKAGQLRKDNKELNDLYFRMATTADQLGNSDKALKFYKAAYDIDSTYLPTLMGRANLLFKVQDWDGAGKIYQTILVQHRDHLKESQVVEVYYRLGQVRLQLNERRKALNMFEKALEIDPHNRPTLLSVIDLQAQQGDFEAVIHAKRSLLHVADTDEKFQILSEIGDVYNDKLQNAQKSIAAYQEALELKPDNHVVLQKVLDRYSETKQWKKAVEVMIKFADLEKVPLRKGKYYYAAGVISRDEIKSLDDAVDYFNQALDSYFAEPDRVLTEDMGRYLKAFEAIDKILTTKKDWKNLERAYRKMIKRMPQRPGDKLLVMLWHNLGEIYRSRLKDFKAATQAFEVAAHMDPENPTRHEILAELYVMSGPEYADKAVAQHMTMLRQEPFKIDSYRALYKIYMDSHQYDKAWCVSNALVFLKKAGPEEQQYYEQYKPRGFVRAKQRMGDEQWKKIIHPDQDRYVSAIFGAIWQGAALVRAQPHKAFGLKRKDRRQIETDQLLFSKVFYYTAQVLNVPMPEVYLQPEQTGEVLLANCVEKKVLIPSFVVRANLLQGRPEKEIAFTCAKFLTYMRPEHYLKLALPTNTELRTAFLSGLVLVQPNFPIGQDQRPLVQQYLPVLQANMQPQWMEALHKVVRRFLQEAGNVDLYRWGNAVEATAHRVGFALSGDLEVAARLVSMEPQQVGGPDAKQKIKELVLFSISEDYFAIRQHLGTVIG